MYLMFMSDTSNEYYKNVVKKAYINSHQNKINKLDN